MQTVEVKIARIGNSRGVRIPADVLRRYAFTDTAIMVESVDGVLLRPKRKTDEKLSWADTAKAMAAASEDWSEWDGVDVDGLDAAPGGMRGARRNGPATGRRRRPTRGEGHEAV